MHGPKRKALGRAPVQWPSALTGGGGVRWCLRVCEGFPTGAAGRGTGLMADSRGAGADKNRGARTHLNCSSFRAFRFATRCPGGRRGLCFRADVGIGPYAGVGAPARADTQVGPYGWAGPRFSVGADAHIRPLHRLLLPSRPAAAKRGAEAVRRPPRRRSTIRHGTAVPEIAENPSVPEGQAKSEHAPIRRPPCARRATAPECAKRFSLWTVHGPFLFWQDKREMGGASRRTSPLAGAKSPVAAVRRPISCYPRWSVRPNR